MEKEGKYIKTIREKRGEATEFDKFKLLEEIEPSRREFIKKLLLTTTFSIPVVQSFSLKETMGRPFPSEPPPPSPFRLPRKSEPPDEQRPFKRSRLIKNK
ncbi:MAG: hypothetical protein SV062_02870 [Thermodesulfobacteriota bacterium]|nr:hypothetical protein [Thermodesulfobacteriota bacterium]